MSGTYDAGFGDINAIIQNAAERPEVTPVMVYQLWNNPPFTIATSPCAPRSTTCSTAPMPTAQPVGPISPRSCNSRNRGAASR